MGNNTKEEFDENYTTLKNSGRHRENGKGLRDNALKFIRESCKGLRFDKSKENEGEGKCKCTGTSMGPEQIPYNMEKDIDRLCLERALERFLESGKKEDAFDVYFCYLEMFVGSYKKTRTMIEMLSEFEANGSGLLMKHRDHYSHSVYVFALGLAIYESNSIYRNAYKEFYEEEFKENAGDKDIDNKVACHFLKHWGMASLFHDIGYPFELPFEQAASYFEVGGDKREGRPYVAYNGLEDYVKLDKRLSRKIGQLYGLEPDKAIKTTDELFAYAISEKLSGTYYFSETEMLDCLKKKPTQPNKFGHFMDHAYFSATVLFKKLFSEMNMELTKTYVDALTAIILHNSLYKFSIAYYKDKKVNIPFELNMHPLAYLLMLCDELQCWDRVAYGRNSKTELHPMGATFDLSEDKIKVTYFYDKEEEGKIKLFQDEYEEWEKTQKGKAPKLKAYSSMYIEKDGICDFLEDIQRIVSLKVVKKIAEEDGKKIREEVQSGSEKKIELVVDKDVKNRAEILENSSRYLSDSNFLHLYNFAISLHAMYESRTYDDKKEWIDLSEKDMEEKFENISLEYKLSNIAQARGFARYLNEIGCFYTDKPVIYKQKNNFTVSELNIIGEMEHDRWNDEKKSMGWRYGTEFYKRDENGKVLKDEKGSTLKDKVKREQLRVHDDVDVKYNKLKSTEQDKDKQPMNDMLKLIKKYDGLRMYELPLGGNKKAK